MSTGTDSHVRLPEGLRAAQQLVSTAVRSDEDAGARVHLTYRELPSRSKQYLDNVLQAWAKWHAETYKAQRASAEACETGQYEYSPAEIAANDVVVLVDKPGLQTDTKAAEHFNIQYESAFEVPKYDRSFDALLQPVRFDKDGDPMAFSTDRPEKRCHNCGSYAHVLQSCPHEKDPLQIRQRREERGGGGRSNCSNTVRYYQDPAAMAHGVLPDGEEYFADLKPGQLSPETRDALGLGPLDPPPWLDKMKQLGYPPMYKHSKQKDEELFIFDDQTGGKPSKAAAKPSQAAASQAAEDQPQHGQQMVQFPGLNAPIPHGADPALWGEPLPELPSAAGSKRAQPDYPTQHDIATQPPLKRIKAEVAPSQPFAFNFQHPQQPDSASAQQQREHAGHDRQPFVFGGGMQGSLHRQDSGANRVHELQHSDRQNPEQHRGLQQEPYQASQQQWPPPAEQAPPDPPELPTGDVGSGHFASLPGGQLYDNMQAVNGYNQSSQQDMLLQQNAALGLADQSFPGSHAFASHQTPGFFSNPYPSHFSNPFAGVHPLYAAQAAMHARVAGYHTPFAPMHAATAMMSAPFPTSYPYQYQQAQSATSLSAAAEAPPPPPLWPPSAYPY